MEEYFKKGKIDNPLNIKRVGGDLPTTKNSSKNITILLGGVTVLALTLNKVWAILLSYIKSPTFTVVFMVIVYTLIISKIVSVTVLEEKKQKKAYKDLLDNKFSDLSVIWEIQDIKEEKILDKSVAYIDYIDGTRTVFLKCIPGSVLNLDEETPRYHYSSIEKVLNYIDDLGYTWNLHVIEEPVTDDKALSFYYDNLRNYKDEDFIDIFTEQLDTIAYVSNLRSAIHVVYIEIRGNGKYKHNMMQNLSGLSEVMGDNHIFKEVGLIETKADLDKWIAYINSVSMFDREELIMNKYKGSYNLNMTSVLGAFDEEGNVLKQFNKDFDIKKIVKKKSIATQASINHDSIQTQKIRSLNKQKNTLTVIEDNQVKEITLPELDESKFKNLIELMYSNDKVKLGD